MSLPTTLSNGYLPPGIYKAALDEITQRFGISTSRRQALADRLRELLRVVQATGQLRRVFIWGSFVTAKPLPRDWRRRTHLVARGLPILPRYESAGNRGGYDR